MRDSPLEVRLAGETDIWSVLEIYNASRAGAGCYFGETLDMERFAPLVDGEEIHVAVVGRRIVGFVSTWVADSFIHHLYVDPQYQGRGVGSELLRMCENVYGLPLSLKCDTRNERAQLFYRSKGWRPSERGMGADGPWERFERRA